MARWPDVGWDEDRGAVADVCPECDRIRVFTVQEHMCYYTFLGFIRVSPDTRAARRRICWHCGFWKFLPFAPYTEYLTFREAEEMPLRDILRITNPKLYQAWREEQDERRDRRR